MLWSLALGASTPRITLLWGLRNERDLYYQEELSLLRSRLPNFSFTTTLSQPTAGWRGSVGRVGPLVTTALVNVSGLEVYLCGNGGMIHDVRDIVRREGICPIYTEQYYA